MGQAAVGLPSSGNASVNLNISKVEQLRLDAAAVGENLSSPWALLHSSLEYDAPVFKQPGVKLPRRIGQVFVLLEEVPHAGPVRNTSESLASATSGQPANLQPSQA